MKIAVLGTGGVGQAFVHRLKVLGHQVVMGTRDPEKKRSEPAFAKFLAQEPGVELLGFREAAEFATMLINATKGAASLDVLALAGAHALRGKVLVDLANPLDFSKGMPPVLVPELCNTNSLGEEIQRRFPDVRVVKTLNTMWNGIMLDPRQLGQTHVNYMCGNDAAAKAEVRVLLSGLGWQETQTLDLGDITAARATEGTLPIWLRVYGVKATGAFNFAVVTA